MPQGKLLKKQVPMFWLFEKLNCIFYALYSFYLTVCELYKRCNLMFRLSSYKLESQEMPKFKNEYLGWPLGPVTTHSFPHLRFWGALKC